mmetsp:Transcript_39221/g.62815  ORF Transcript_39221/g.62815 Transcript_39221/m.62815 type:complete len:267 (+) Transcript_39221:936-1736(+)
MYFIICAVSHAQKALMKTRFPLRSATAVPNMPALMAIQKAPRSVSHASPRVCAGRSAMTRAGAGAGDGGAVGEPSVIATKPTRREMLWKRPSTVRNANASAWGLASFTDVGSFARAARGATSSPCAAPAGERFGCAILRLDAGVAPAANRRGLSAARADADVGVTACATPALRPPPARATAASTHTAADPPIAACILQRPRARQRPYPVFPNPSLGTGCGSAQLSGGVIPHKATLERKRKERLGSRVSPSSPPSPLEASPLGRLFL